GRKGYHAVSRHPHARRVRMLVLLRWDAPLCFANGEIFRERVLRAVDESPEPARWIVIAAEPVTDIDLTAADVLEQPHHELAARQVKLVFAELKGPVKDSLKHYGMYSMFGDNNFFPTIGEAVSGYVETHQIEWHDWEDAR
ncbi:sodium-independent anion transporter, partial [Burkholderia pseudomallei]|uniref:sodium-independent anion transporter n=1 Tax=Burkholderia pseudomallei TaxID=28450 RepID=UPI0021F70108